MSVSQTMSESGSRSQRLYRTAEETEKPERVKKVFVRSGIRFDYLLADPDQTFIRELCRYHVSGQLRAAPEHISDNVLRMMGKPPVSVYERFVEAFEKTNRELKMEQYCVPYLMSSHPGSTLQDAIALAEYLHKHHLNPRQVQDYCPLLVRDQPACITPGSIP